MVIKHMASKIGPKIKRRITLCWHGENHQFYNVASSDAKAIKLATWKLEDKLGLMRGATKGYFAADIAGRVSVEIL